MRQERHTIGYRGYGARLNYRLFIELSVRRRQIGPRENEHEYTRLSIRRVSSSFSTRVRTRRTFRGTTLLFLLLLRIESAFEREKER